MVDGRWSMSFVVCCLVAARTSSTASLRHALALLALALTLKMSFFTGGVFAVVSMLGANAIRRVPIFSGMRPPAPLAPAPHLMPNHALSLTLLLS